MRKDSYLNISKGFTLIELLVVIAIIALLSSVVLASLTTAREKARISQTLAKVRELSSALRMYNNDVGEYPANPCKWDCPASKDPLITNVGDKTGWAGPYIPASGSFSSALTPWKGYIGYEKYPYTDPISGKEYSLPAIIIGVSSRTAEGGSVTLASPVAWDSLKKMDEIMDDGNVDTGNFVAPMNNSSFAEYMEFPSGRVTYTVEPSVKN